MELSPESTETTFEYVPLFLLIASVGIALCVCSRNRTAPPLLPRYRTHMGAHVTARAEPMAPIETFVHEPLSSSTQELPKLSFRYL
jgi:hypothetical protein